jgi:hypothetical protein
VASRRDEAAERFFDGHPDALEVFRAVWAILDDIGPFELRVSKSQVAFRRRKAFAWLWLPGRWLRKPSAEIVLSMALGQADPSSRFKEVVQPAPTVWMHHLEIHGPDELDAEVEGWLRRAHDRA